MIERKSKRDTEKKKKKKERVVNIEDTDRMK